jgi:hypothetical protein
MTLIPSPAPTPARANCRKANVFVCSMLQAVAAQEMAGLVPDDAGELGFVAEA